MKTVLKTITRASLVGLMFSSSAYAAELVTGEEIKNALVGKTDQGSMLSGMYTQYYMADGTIKADGYTGKWTVTEDSMCFEFGGESSGCWQAAVDGPLIVWYKDGKIDGTAVVVDGNPNNF